jgi:preprotein translocase subunit SecB
MKAAQIQLTNYFVSELQFAANRDFKEETPSSVTAAELQVTHQASPAAENKRQWQITLRIALNASPESNSPYSFLVEMIGFIDVAESVSDDRIERFARINGTSLVFAAAREIVKAATSRGPFKPLMLPTVTFWEPKTNAPPASDVLVGEQSQQTAPAQVSDKLTAEGNDLKQ